MAVKFRKPMDKKQGLKILAYGEDGTGKSIYTLSFPKVAVVDTESKLGVYENHPVYGKNIRAIADTTNYYDLIELYQNVNENPKDFGTFVTDSESNMYESMQVAMMEVEEERAKKKKTNIDDQTVSQRGWGKVKLNNARLKNLKAQASAKGITIISVAHKEDIMQDMGGGKSVKIGEKPALRKNSKHDYDVILKFFKEKDMATGKWRFKAEVEKDTTLTFELGTILENVTYENTFKQYIEGNENKQIIETGYDKAIEGVIETATEEAETFEQVSKEFAEKFKELSAINPENKIIIATKLKEKGVDSYTDPKFFNQLKEVLTFMKTM